MQNSYLFYDLETSGLNKCFDQVFQFAAIRTDLDLKEVDRYKIFVKLNPDVIPSPMAVLVHQITFAEMQNGIGEDEAMLEIHRLFNTPGTISVGYNSLDFDDEFLRFSFYRNLLAPYTHQYANNCGRMDIYPMLVMYYLFKPATVNWPKINGIPSLKLEHLGKANGLATGNAHAAMNDVEVTLRLARLLKKEQAMWDYLCGCFDKKTDLARLVKLTFVADKYRGGLLIDGNLGAAKFYQSSVVGLGLHNHYKNQSLWLPLDCFALFDINNSNIATATFVNRKRFGEPPLLLPLCDRFNRYLSNDRLQLMATNLIWLKKNPELFSEIASYHREYKYPIIPDLDVDAALYQIGFISDEERWQCDRFHITNSQGKIAIIDNFVNNNLRLQALRIMGRNYPEALTKRQDLYAEFMSYMTQIRSGKVILNYKNEVRLTPHAALAEIENLRQTRSLSQVQSKLLTELSENLLKKFT
ncbi:MAG: exodeoxyribonuclease I [Coxiellaceae bacterium]|jgi:exodeoxyribonuclease-1|nr:exodeoxyribonuclease I [Coxiellaceae bacterium]